MTPLLDLVDDLSACRQRVHTLQLAADGMVGLNSRTGNALARNLDDLDKHLEAIRDALEEMANDASNDAGTEERASA